MAPLSSQIESLSSINILVEAFKAFDSDNDGLITASELGGMMSSLGHRTSDGEAREMARMGDSDGDGLLSVADVVGMMSPTDNSDLAALLGSALSAFDEAETVSSEELFEVLGCMDRLSGENCRDIIASLDGDGDGEVNIEDLKLVVQALI